MAETVPAIGCSCSWAPHLREGQVGNFVLPFSFSFLQFLAPWDTLSLSCAFPALVLNQPFPQRTPAFNIEQIWEAEFSVQGDQCYGGVNAFNANQCCSLHTRHADVPTLVMSCPHFWTRQLIPIIPALSRRDKRRAVSSWPPWAP